MFLKLRLYCVFLAICTCERWEKDWTGLVHASLVSSDNPTLQLLGREMNERVGKRGRGLEVRPTSMVVKDGVFFPNKERCGCCGGWSHVLNRLLKCSLCNVAVHEHCYGVGGGVSELGWKCSPCSEGVNADEIACMLCGNEGGGFKRVVRGGKGWIHILCAIWTPDIYFLDPMGVDGICLDAVDPDRYKLRCCLCGKRGMCMQCHGARCLVAYHPWCMFSAGHNHYPRVVTVGDAVTPETLPFSSYCPKHIKMCPAPYDPPPQPQSDREVMEWMDRKSKSNVCGFSTTSGEGSHQSLHNRDGSMSPELSEEFIDADDIFVDPQDATAIDGHDFDFHSKPSGRSSPPMLKRMFTFQQWPGYSLGHDMDVEHFWSVVGSYYPESQTEICLKTSLNAIDKAIPKVDDNNPAFGVNSAIGGQQRHPIPEEGKEELQNGGGVASEQNKTLNRDDIHSGPISSLHQKGFVTICLENGCHRASCLFELSKNGELKSEIDPVLLGSSISELNLDNHHHVKQERTNTVGDLHDTRIALREFTCKRTPVGQQQLDSSSSAENEIEICQELYLMQKRLRGVLQSVKRLLEPAKENARYHATKAHDIQKYWNSVECRYRQMKTWKAVVVMLLSGNRDRKSGFNKHIQEEIPASWRMIVKGRPAVPSSSKVVVNPADEADSLCSVCFDGNAPADNHIVFCDGCNIGVHQRCYGLKGIPEYEFYCDRCLFLQSKVRRMSSSFQVDLAVPGLVQPPGAPQLQIPQCALCPVLHGGLKQTDDGRWVHLCCALWVPGVRIGEIENMAPISLSSVQFQSTESCSFCKQMIGALLSCKGEREDGQPCSVKFHYLCAWFAGCVMEAKLPPGADLSSGYEDGYPCTVELYCLCEDHSTNQRALEEQKCLRANYCMVTEPPAVMAYTKKPRKQQSGVGRGGKRASQPVAELYPDNYTSYPCSACICPADTVIGLLGNDKVNNNGNDDSIGNPVVCCQVCGITVHLRCYGAEKAHKNMEPESSWTCAACSKGIHYPQCGLCPRRGGTFFSTSRGSRSLATMVHCYCADHTPGVTVITSHERTPHVDLMGVPNELRSKHKCVLCNHKQGVCVKCAHHGCFIYFHPLCARHYGLYSNPFPPSELGRCWPFKYTHYCQKHTPDGVFRLSNGHFVDAWAVYKLRQDLDRVRLIIDLVRKREKVKRAMWRTACAHFEACMDQAREEVRKQIENVPRSGRCRNLEIAELKGGKSTTSGKENGEKGSSSTDDSSSKVEEDNGDNYSSKNSEEGSENEGNDDVYPSEAVFDLFRPYGKRLDGSPWDEGQRILEEQQLKEATVLEAKKDREFQYSVANKARELRRQFRRDEGSIVLLRRKRSVTLDSNDSYNDPKSAKNVVNDLTSLPGWWNGVMDRTEQPRQDFSVVLENLAGYSALNRAHEMLPPEKAPSISEDPKRVKLDRQLKFIVDAIVECRVSVTDEKKSKPYGSRSTDSNGDDSEGEQQWQTLDDSGKRLLGEMFMHVPTDEEYPKYWELIREPVDTDSMFRKVQEFRYDSLDELLQDVKQLVTNARTLRRHALLNDAICLQAVSKKAYKEATKEEKKKLLRSLPTVVRGHDGAVTRKHRGSVQWGGSDTQTSIRKRSRGGGEMGSSSTAEQQPICSTCGGCCILREGSSNYNKGRLGQEIQRFPILSSENHCELCLNQNATSFIGRRVWILWPQDHEWYKGKIQAYDPSSYKHRVVYDDGEWDFLHLSDSYMLWLSNDRNKDPRHPPRIQDVHKPTKKKSRKCAETSWKQREAVEKQPSRYKKKSLSLTITKGRQKVVVDYHQKRKKSSTAAGAISRGGRGTKNAISTTTVLKERGNNGVVKSLRTRSMGGGGAQKQQEPPLQVHKQKDKYKKRSHGKMITNIILNPPKKVDSHDRSSKRIRSTNRKRTSRSVKEEDHDYEDFEDYKDLNYNEKSKKNQGMISSSMRSTRSCRSRISCTQRSSSHVVSESITPKRIKFIHGSAHHGSNSKRNS